MSASQCTGMSPAGKFIASTIRLRTTEGFPVFSSQSTKGSSGGDSPRRGIEALESDATTSMTTSEDLRLRGIMQIIKGALD